MLQVRPSNSRGYAQHGWLESYHSFSFASYYDPAYMGYSVLRVINDDKVAPGTGFGMHAHHDMEIITYMLEGELRHTDSMGHSAVLRAGDVQHMTAGTGIRHSEMNTSLQTTAHFLQIWIMPDTLGLPPAYQDHSLALADKLNRWATVAAPAGQPGAEHAALQVHQDLKLYATQLSEAQTLPLTVTSGRCAYVQVARGEITIAGQRLRSGDAVQLDTPATLTVCAQAASELLWFDLPVVTGQA